MKIEKLYVAFTLLLAVLFVSSCSDDDEQYPITISNVDGSVTYNAEYCNLRLTPYSSSSFFYIHGGDGVYYINNSDKQTATVNFDGKVLSIEPNAEGSTWITVTDKSGNEFSLYVFVSYPMMVFNVSEHDVFVDGDDLTIGEMKKLKEEVLDDILVQSGGKYEFILTSPGFTEGDVKVYPTLHSSRRQEGTFKREEVQVNDRSFNQIAVQIGEKKRVYYLTSSRVETEMIYYLLYGADGVSRSSESYSLMTLIEDVTETYKEAYPGLTKAYAMQRFTVMNY